MHLGHLTVSNRTLYVEIDGGNDANDWRGPSATDGFIDLATIWAAMVGGYAAAYGALTLIAWCFT